MTEVVERKSKWGKVGKVAIIFVTILACAAGVVYSLTDTSKAASTYEKNRERAIRSGMVFDAQTAAPLYSVPNSDNVLPDITEPLKALASLSDYEKPLSDKQFLEKWTDHQKDFEAVERLSERHHMMPIRKIIASAYEGTPHYTWTKYSVRTLLRRALTAHDNNDLQLTKRLLSAAARLTVMVDDDPDFLATLIRVACDASVTNLLRRVVAFHGHDLAWQPVISNTLAILDKPYDLRPSIRRQHWSSYYSAQVFLGTLKDPDSYYHEGDLIFKAIKFVPRYREATLSRIHDFYATQMEAYPSDIRDYVAIEKLTERAGDFIDQEGFSFKIAQIVSPTFREIPRSLHRNVTNRYTVCQAFEIMRTNSDPAKGLLLKDHFAKDVDGAPIRISQTAKSWIVYSVGKNGIDDGGFFDQSGKDDYIVALSPAAIPPPIKSSSSASPARAPAGSAPAKP